MTPDELLKHLQENAGTKISNINQTSIDKDVKGFNSFKEFEEHQIKNSKPTIYDRISDATAKQYNGSLAARERVAKIESYYNESRNRVGKDVTFNTLTTQEEVNASIKEDVAKKNLDLSGIVGILFLIGTVVFIMFRFMRWLDKKETQTQTIQPNTQSNIQKSTSEKKEPAITTSQLKPSLEEREAAMSLILFFIGFCDDVAEGNPVVDQVMLQSVAFLNLSPKPANLFRITQKFKDADDIIDHIKGITDKRTIEMLLLSCYDICNTCGKPQALNILKNIATELGYHYDEFEELIHTYS